MFIWAQTLSLHCTADLAIEGDESSKGTTFKKNDGEKEDNNSSLQEGVKKVEKKRERSNVYTNPLTNPQRNPNVDPKRTEPLTGIEINAIKEAHKRYPEFGAWNLSLLLSNEFAVHVSTMSILRVLYPERYKSSKNDEKVKFYISMINISFGISRVLKRRFLNISDSETSRRGSGLDMEKPPHLY